MTTAAILEISGPFLTQRLIDSLLRSSPVPLGQVVVIVLAGLMVLWRKATVGEFVLFVALQDMAYQPVSQLSILFPRLRRALSRAVEGGPACGRQA